MANPRPRARASSDCLGTSATSAPARFRHSQELSSVLAHRTRSIRAAKPLLARLLHRQSVGALTGRAAFPSHGLRSRNRLSATAAFACGCRISREPWRNLQRGSPASRRNRARMANQRRRRPSRCRDRQRTAFVADLCDSQASLRQRGCRAPFDGERARADVVPMHQMRRMRPSGASVGRPNQARHGQRAGRSHCVPERKRRPSR
jgi:hypothetical protein